MNFRARFSTIISCGLMASALSLTGCVSQDYLGDHYAPTTHVDVFYNQTGIPAGYKVMGDDRAEAGSGMAAEDIVKKIVEEAQKDGADAISIKGMELVVTGTQTNTNGDVSASSTDSVHHNHADSNADAQYSQDTQTTVNKDKVITATFLKRIQ